jgi:hypothetical protein
MFRAAIVLMAVVALVGAERYATHYAARQREVVAYQILTYQALAVGDSGVVCLVGTTRRGDMVLFAPAYQVRRFERTVETRVLVDPREACRHNYGVPDSIPMRWKPAWLRGELRDPVDTTTPRAGRRARL